MKKICSVFLILTLFIMILPLGSVCFAEEAPTSGTMGGCTWTLEGTVLTISGEGSMEDYSVDTWRDKITSVIIENGVTGIGFYAFLSCTKLESITISGTVREIDPYAFSDCSSLESIVVDSENENFASVDGVLFNADKTELIYYPQNKKGSSYSVPSGVVTFRERSFDHCKNLKSIILPNSVESICNEAFRFCNNLENITLTNSVRYIENGAFFHCENIKNVYYEGTREEFVSNLYGHFAGATRYFLEDGKYVEDTSAEDTVTAFILIFLGMLLLKFLTIFIPVVVCVIILFVIIRIIIKNKVKMN